MFIPLRTSRELRRRPNTTVALILLNMLVYLVGLVAASQRWFTMEDMVQFGSLGREPFRPWTLLTYQFLHDPSSIWHLAFNMVFLWTFGGPVEDRLGRAGYVAFYLLGGVVAGLAHMAVSPSPVIGASGSVAAVTGAFAALAPRARIHVLFVFILITMMSIPAMWFVAIYVAIDMMRSVGDLLGGSNRVAWGAHLGGYAYGFGLSVLLLATRLLPRDDYDIWFIFRQQQRRSAYRRAIRGSASGAFTSASADTAKRVGRTSVGSKKKAAAEAPPSPPDARTREEREAIVRHLADHRGDEAMAGYETLVARVPNAVLPQDRQLEIATRLHAAGRHEMAAKAFELMLEHYPAHHEANDARLVLSLLLVRHLGRPADALPHIDRAERLLSDEGLRQLAATLRTEIESASGGESGS